MNIKQSRYKDTRGIYQKISRKRIKSFLMLSNNVDYVYFLNEELKSPAASTDADPAGM
jgi:hypothetical protein